MLLRLVRDLDTLVVPTESEALLLENNLIKQHRPRFNVMWRDDKSYPRVAVTLGEPFPRVLVTRRLDLPGARFFGPYTDVGMLRRTLRIINRCLAPCVGYQSREAYRSMIDDVLAFLEGKTVEVRSRLRERMEEASRHLDFERAAGIRDALQWLEQLEQPQAVETVTGRDADAIGFARDGDDAVGVILRLRGGKILAREQRFFENLTGAGDDEILGMFLVGHYVRAEERARRVVLPFPPADLEAIAELAAGQQWIVPHRGANQRLVALADQNAQHLMESFKIESLETEDRVEDPVYALGRDRDLGLTAVPRSFVCVDVSTNQGRDTVGSLVWFEGGRPKKSEYRRYKIKEPEGQQDDFAALHEVLSRFLSWWTAARVSSARRCGHSRSTVFRTYPWPASPSEKRRSSWWGARRASGCPSARRRCASCSGPGTRHTGSPSRTAASGGRRAL
jgi:excinuclease ABC subunit C